MSSETSNDQVRSKFSSRIQRLKKAQFRRLGLRHELMSMVREKKTLYDLFSNYHTSSLTRSSNKLTGRETGKVTYNIKCLELTVMEQKLDRRRPDSGAKVLEGISPGRRHLW